VTSISGNDALEARAQEKVAILTDYERRHPRQGPDRDGRAYDPERDVIEGWRSTWVVGERAEIDTARTATIKSRTWEGFAWADHRFVLSDERGNALIVGYNEDARKWFVDTTTPVHLPVEWVTEFVTDLEELGTIRALEDPRDLHERIVALAGATHSTVPSLDEVAEYLAARRAQ
jgi:hypothetical protein